MNIFSQIQAKKPTSNTFDLSHDRKMSLNMGELVPIAALECIPGDKFNMSTSQMLRFAPMIAPIMHRVTVYTHFFFVPNRILWPNWEDFITGGPDGTSEPAFPTLESAGSAKGSLEDYLGVPTVPNTGNLRQFQTSALPCAAYNKIYNEYYRDQNLIEPVGDECRDGSNDLGFITRQIQKRAWEHDYFTSGLPWTQKGAEATLPLGTTAPLLIDRTEATVIGAIDGSALPTSSLIDQLAVGVPSAVGNIRTAGELSYIDTTTNTTVDLSDATASSINDLRRAFKLQEWLEKNARGGSRYIESIYSHFGVKSPDARLQRPEFLGGGSSPVSISEVLQTSGNDQQPTPQGNMAGHGISVGAANNFSHFCHEHGYIIGIMSVIPKTAYQQGLPKHFSKFDKFDYFWPSFGHLGEQPILNQEIYLDEPLDEANEDTFAYTPRYAEYKYIPSSVHGEMRDSLDIWHMGRKFENPPQLNQDFIESTPTNRIFAVTDSEKLYAHVFHRIKASRRMPFFGTPSF